MSDEENARIRLEHAALLKEKVEAEALWHAEVRATLKQHGDVLATIHLQIGEWARIETRLTTCEARIKVLEDFKLRALGYWTGALAVLVLAWRLAEHFLK